MVVFKPECDVGKIVIAKEAFKRAGLLTVSGRYVMLTHDVIKPVFTNGNYGVFKSVCKYLLGQTVLVLELGGEDAIQRTRIVVGTSAIPGVCDQKSLRFIFANKDGFPPPMNFFGRIIHYRNYIQRSRNAEEAEKHRRILFDNTLLWKPE
jgi:nucleoside diphosphate kinase